MAIVSLNTSRLILRKWSEFDALDMYDYAKSNVVGPNAGWPSHQSVEESAAIISRFLKSNEVWAIEHKAHGKVIGSIGLHKDEKRSGINCRMLGYVLSSDYWGQGLMSEAVQAILKHGFMSMELDLISVYHYPFNERSRKVIVKNGFHFEGILRQASSIYDGTIYDDVCYSMTKEEYINFINNVESER